MRGRSRRNLLLLIPLLMVTSAPAQDADELVQKLQGKYAELESFSADFDQVFVDRNVELRESGRLLMKKPGRMYWEYKKPITKLFILDGEKSYFYVPQDKQVLVSEMEMDGARIPLLFLLGKGNIQRDFEVELGEEPRLDPQNVVMRLIPRQRQGDFSEVVLEIDRSQYLIRRLVVVEPIGNRNEYILSNLQENVAISDRQFRFQIPSGVEVLSP